MLQKIGQFTGKYHAEHCKCTCEWCFLAMDYAMKNSLMPTPTRSASKDAPVENIAAESEVK